jgi:hypothetical protein
MKPPIKPYPFSPPEINSKGLSSLEHSLQTEFDFETSSQSDGLTSWHRERDDVMRELAIKLGLPIDHQAEVRPKDGVVVRGKLRVGEVLISLENFSRGKLALAVDGFVFTYSEIESCVRLD